MVPISITTGHGSGGRLTQHLTQAILKHFDLDGFQMEDSAFISTDLAVSMDGYTVFPLDFPGGNIGKLAVCGSANDLAVRGVEPLFLTLSLIIEEGLEMRQLEHYMQSAAQTARDGGIHLVAGDTKVVPRGSADKLFITTCALGRKITPLLLQTSNLREGDSLILTTAPGRHGAALAATRFNIEALDLKSDCALLWPILKPLTGLSGLRCMRDCTRGGLGTVLCEWAESTGLGIVIEESALPVDSSAASVADILGFDLLYLASEGCALIAVAREQSDECLEYLKQNVCSLDAAIIGHVTTEHPGLVGMRTLIGGTRLIDMPMGEILPRIC